jgi:hypothetical protein
MPGVSVTGASKPTRTPSRLDRAVRLIAAGFFVWPLVHYLLSESLSFDPWKLGGWAMYATPVPRLGIRIAVAGKADEWSRLEQVPQYATEELQTFLRRRAMLGSWIEPRRLAQLLLANDRKITAVKIEFVALRFDGGARRFRSRTQEYTFRRE